MSGKTDDYEKRFKNLINNTNLFYIETDSSGNIKLCSSSVPGITGYSHEELQNSSIYDLFSFETDSEYFSVFLNKEKAVNGYEFTLSGKNKNEIILRTVSLEEISDGIFAFIAEDVTLDSETEESGYSCTEKNNIPEEKGSENTRKDIDNICAVIAHEFSSPVRAIEAYGSIIAEELKGKDMSYAEEAVSEIKRYCRQAAELARNMIDYSEIGAKAPEKERIDIRSIIVSCLNDLKIIYGNTDIHAEISDLPEIYGDRFLLKHAVYNILDNSVKYSSGKKCAEISISYSSSDNENIFFFSDRGAGFDVSSASDPFALFCRHHSDDEFKGSGTGLAVVKRIIEKHSGDISIRSEKNKGCTVIISLKK